MRHLFALFALLTLLLCTCCAHTPPRLVGPSYDVPGAVMTFHVDTAFTAGERKVLETSVSNLETQTRGFLKVVLIYDLDDNVETWKAHMEDDVLLKVGSDSDWVVKYEAENLPQGASLLGLTGRGDRGPDATTVVLIYDRLNTVAMYTSVTMHELMHAFGVKHVGDRFSLMAPSTRARPAICLHEADVVEMCKVYGCDADRIGWCN